MSKSKRAKAKHCKEPKPFRLLDLPPEIWSKIDKMIIQDAAICYASTIGSVPMKSRQAHACGLQDKTPVPAATQQPPITRTCKILREELLPLYYSTKIDIIIDGIGSQSSTIGKWLRAIRAENRRALKTMWLCREGVAARLDPQGDHSVTVERLWRHWKVELRIYWSRDQWRWLDRIVLL